MKASIETNKDADLLYKCFKPEIKKWNRSEVSVTKTKGKIRFNIDAEDAVALRATLNSVTALIAVHQKTDNLIKDNG